MRNELDELRHRNYLSLKEEKEACLPDCESASSSGGVSPLNATALKDLANAQS